MGSHLESIKRLILAATPPGHVQRSRDEAIEWDRMVAEYAEEALPALRSLLAEVERLREAERKLANMTESREFWKQLVKDERTRLNQPMPEEA